MRWEIVKNSNNIAMKQPKLVLIYILGTLFPLQKVVLIIDNIKKGCSDNSRMVGRTKTNEDIIHTMLIESDPYIASLRIHENRKKRSFWRSERIVNFWDVNIKFI